MKIRHSSFVIRILITLCALLFKIQAGVLTPVVGYVTDSQGNPYVGTNITITAWPPTNAITGVNTNLVANLAITDTTGANGYFSNSLAPGSYRLQIPGFTHGITFNVVSNTLPLNLAQISGAPVPVFMNFTLAQFSDAGTMAYASTNNYVGNNYGAVSNAAGFDIATNGGPVATSQLPYTPATNGGSITYSQLPFTPASNNYVGVSNAVQFVIATNGGPVAVAQLPYTPATNSYAALTNILGYVPDGTNAPIANSRLTTNVLVSISVAGPPASITTNFGICWLVFYTNAPPATAFTNLPNGSFCSTTNGQFFVLSNLTWLVK